MKKISLKKLIDLNLFWFALNFHWTAFLVIVLQTQVQHFVPPEKKELYLGIVLALGALMAMITMPIIGAISDKVTYRLGRCRHFILFGTLAGIFTLLGMLYSPNLLIYAIFFLFLEIFMNIANAPYQAFIPDLVAPEQRGTASGLYGFFYLLGQIGGAVVAGIMIDKGLLNWFYYLDIFLLVIFMIYTMIFVKEKPLEKKEPIKLISFFKSLWISPRKYPDFAWVFLTRGLIMLGIYTILDFLLYFLQFKFHLKEAGTQTSLLVLIASVVAAISVYVAGFVSDKWGKKPLIYFAGGVMAIAGIVFITLHSFTQAIVAACIFGLGYGAFTSVDLALVTLVLPPNDSHAKDMGIWSIASVFPQTIAAFLGGLVIFVFNKIILNSGYYAVFISVIIYTILGTIFISKVKGTK